MKRTIQVKGFKKLCIIQLLALLLCALPSRALSHFGALIPSDDIVEQGESRQVTLRLEFLHPFEGEVMSWGRPSEFGLVFRGEKIDLTAGLTSVKQKGKISWEYVYSVKRPGTYLFYVKPVPYFEPSEKTFIIHYTKVYVNAFGLESGWEDQLGTKIEIVPLTRPFGLWTGNLIRGRVLVDGKPAAGIDVEVEYLARGTLKAPSSPLITQAMKTDGQGIFSYAMPKAGWWGFAAITEGESFLKKDGKVYPVEIGGVLWVKTVDMPR